MTDITLCTNVLSPLRGDCRRACDGFDDPGQRYAMFSPGYGGTGPLCDHMIPVETYSTDSTEGGYRVGDKHP